jgi:hypothetical protein
MDILGKSPVLRIRCLFEPGSGMGKKSISGSGMNIPDHNSENIEKNLNSLMRIRVF